MRITQENGLQFVGKTLQGRAFHYFPLKVVQDPDGKIAVIDRNKVRMVVPSETDHPIYQIYFDSVED
jgi:hypothetical protein